MEKDIVCPYIWVVVATIFVSELLLPTKEAEAEGAKHGTYVFSQVLLWCLEILP